MLSVLAEMLSGTAAPLSLLTEVLLASVGQIGLAGHRPVAQGFSFGQGNKGSERECRGVDTRGVSVLTPEFSRAPTRDEVVSSGHTLR
jgi:hypothetical protein